MTQQVGGGSAVRSVEDKRAVISFIQTQIPCRNCKKKSLVVVTFSPKTVRCRDCGEKYSME